MLPNLSPSPNLYTKYRVTYQVRERKVPILIRSIIV